MLLSGISDRQLGCLACGALPSDCSFKEGAELSLVRNYRIDRPGSPARLTLSPHLFSSCRTTSRLNGIFSALAEFERELISKRTVAGLASARARGRKGGRPFKMTAAKLRLAMAAMGQPETKVSDLCEELGITRQTLYRHVSPKGELRPDGVKLLARNGTGSQ